MSITGATPKSNRTITASLLNVGVVLKSDLEDVESNVNAVSLSGKTLGGLVVATDADGTAPAMFMATGSSASSPWIDLSGGGATVSWADIADKPAFIASGSSQQEARDAIGAGGVKTLVADISDASATGRAAIKAGVVAYGATQSDARTSIGAGTSSLSIGVTSSTAMAGNKVPTSTDRGGVIKQAAVADLATGADLPTTVSKVNAILAALRSSGLLT